MVKVNARRMEYKSQKIVKKHEVYIILFLISCHFIIEWPRKFYYCFSFFIIGK